MKILVVDDDFLVREVLRDTIDHYLEASVIMAGSAEAGLAEFAESWPDVVITDLRMETPDAGLWLAEKIKIMSPVTPVIMISTDQPESRSIDVSLRKPFKIDELLQALDKLWKCADVRRK